MDAKIARGLIISVFNLLMAALYTISGVVFVVYSFSAYPVFTQMDLATFGIGMFLLINGLLGSLGYLPTDVEEKEDSKSPE